MSEYIIEVEYDTFNGTFTQKRCEEIVRCRDCKHAQVRHPLNPITGIPTGIEVWRCGHFWNADELPEVEPDGFCAWGERREDA